MTDSTTPSDPGTTAAVAAHNRTKVYVDGPDGIRVPFIEVALSDPPPATAPPEPPGPALRHVGTRLRADGRSARPAPSLDHGAG